MIKVVAFVFVVLAAQVACDVSLTEDQYRKIYDLYNTEYGRPFDNDRYEAFKENSNFVANENINARSISKRQDAVASRDLTLKVNQFSDLTNEEFIDTYTGTPQSLIEAYLAGAAAAALTVGAIVGIAVGAAAGTAAVGGGGYVIYKKVKSASPQAPEAELEATPTSNNNAEPGAPKKKGVNIFDFNPATFISITARSPPRKV